MNCTFYIVDDDRSVRKMVSQIIETHIPDSLSAQSDDPWHGVQEILRTQPDIVILDLLMEEMDGIEVAHHLRQSNYRGKIVMLSEVTAKEMIEKAYSQGVDDYISKPINVAEVVKVLKRTMEHLQLQTYVRLMGTPQALTPGSAVGTSLNVSEVKYKHLLINIYKELGIVGEPGGEELIFLVTKLQEGCCPFTARDASLNQYYAWLKENFPPYSYENISIKGIEQRLRRFVQTAMENLAHMGIEDFSNYKFERYSTILFNFKTIKMEMDYLRKRSSDRGKVDIKRFIDGLLATIE